MTVSVDKEKCIGCGACVSIAPEVFEMKEGKCVVKNPNGDKDYPEKVRDAKESCPVGAIITS